MNNLPFKSTDDAFEYAQKYFVKNKLSPNLSFIGIVRFVDDVRSPPVYMVEIVCKAGNFFKRQTSMIVAALKHPELTIPIKENDLVVFGAKNILTEIPTGNLLYKLKPELNLDSLEFNKSEEKFQAPEVDVTKEEEQGIKLWKYEVDGRYGLILPECEIIEDESYLYFCQTNRKKLCAAWDIKKKRWEVNINRSSLDGLSFSTPKRFEEIVFEEKSRNEGTVSSI